jgi:hypothetical protein
MLDTKYPAKYCVTNLGEGGATLQQAPHGDSPYWQRRSFKRLTYFKWDFVVIMLGTNDAKDACGAPASYCGTAKPPYNSCCNWPHAGQGTNWTQDCSAMNCPFVNDYAKLLTLVKTLGSNNSTPPKIWLAAPPPLMNGGSPGSTAKPYGMNQTIINDIFPALLPKINSANGLANKVIDVFGEPWSEHAPSLPPSLSLPPSIHQVLWAALVDSNVVTRRQVPATTSSALIR